MPDREKVIKGLHAHANGCGYRSDYCDAIECPYRYGDESCDIEEMCRDALELLKEQEPVVRCKDCKYAYLTDDGECKYCEMEKDDNGSLIERYRSWDWFCAEGERRSET